MSAIRLDVLSAESQRLIHELTEVPHVQPEIHVSYGDESLLVRLIGRGARMIVLLGAEVFDARLRVTTRVGRARGCADSRAT